MGALWKAARAEKDWVLFRRPDQTFAATHNFAYFSYSARDGGKDGVEFAD